MAVGAGTWKRREVTTRGSDPTVMIEWFKKWELVTGGKHLILITEFQTVYRIEVDGEVWDEPEMVAAAEALHRRLESEFEAEQEATWALQHPLENSADAAEEWSIDARMAERGVCEHGYADGCRACDPDGR